jgi:hypothetical protein
LCFQAIAGEFLGLGHRVNNSRYLSTNTFLALGLGTDLDGIQVSAYERSRLWSCKFARQISEDTGGVPVRIYEPTKHRAPASPALIWIHGGGWVSKAASESIQ